MKFDNAKVLVISTITICSFMILFSPDDAFAALNPPSAVTAQATSQTAITVTISAPANPAPDVFRGYQIQRAIQGGAFTTIVANSTSTTLSDSNLIDSTTYQYKVYALYNLGRFSTPTNATATTFGFGSGDCTGDCLAPTLGLDKKGSRFVENGFSYNGNPVDVELFYTPYPLIQTEVGVLNKAVFKIFEDGGPDEIRHLDLAFGLAKGEILANSKARIEWDRTWDGIETINVVDPEHTLQDVEVRTSDVRCMEDESIKYECLQVEIFHTFRAPLEFDIVATNVWDEKRNSWQNYYNHGVEVIGESMDGPKQYIGIHHGQVILLTETDKNKAVDDQGNTWTFDKEWLMDYIPKGKVVDEVSKYHGIDRDHAYFNFYKQGQILVAQKTLDEIMEKTRYTDAPVDKQSIHKMLKLSEAQQKMAGMELMKSLHYRG